MSQNRYVPPASTNAPFEHREQEPTPGRDQRAIGGKYQRPGRSTTGSAEDSNDVSPEKTATRVGWGCASGVTSTNRP